MRPSNIKPRLKGISFGKRDIQLFCSILFLFLVPAAGEARAAVITTPPDLSPGDQYRLAFVTSGSRLPSDFIEDYNTFVDGFGDTILPGDWKAIASTFHSDAVQMSARDNTGTQGDAAIPIYNVLGNRVADGYDDLWDGSIQTSIAYNENGETEINFVLTGTHQTGVIWSAQYYTNYGYTLPGSYLNEDWINFGETLTASTLWDDDGLSGGPKMYGLSEVLVVPIPEPSTALFLGLGLTGLAGKRPRRNRS